MILAAFLAFAAVADAKSAPALLAQSSEDAANAPLVDQQPEADAVRRFERDSMGYLANGKDSNSRSRISPFFPSHICQTTGVISMRFDKYAIKTGKCATVYLGLERKQPV